MGALTPEGKIKAKVTKLLKQYKLWYFFPAANGMGRAGIPDIITIVSGIFVGIEVKANRSKRPTQLQLFCGKAIQNAGGEWFLVCDDASLAHVEQYINTKVSQHVSSGEGQSTGTKATESK